MTKYLCTTVDGVFQMLARYCEEQVRICEEDQQESELADGGATKSMSRSRRRSKRTHDHPDPILEDLSMLVRICAEQVGICEEDQQEAEARARHGAHHSRPPEIFINLHEVMIPRVVLVVLDDQAGPNAHQQRSTDVEDLREVFSGDEHDAISLSRYDIPSKAVIPNDSKS